MKQITMDFATYEGELEAERLAGAKISIQLIERIKDAFRQWTETNGKKP